MELVRLTVNGYPCLDKEMYLSDLMRHMKQKQALILRNEGAAAGIMGFSAKTGTIDFWAVHPQYRDRGIEKVFLDKLQNELLPGREISVTTYRSKDRADTGWRDQYLRLGFEEKELMTEFGYPTQRFVLHPKGKEETQDGKQSE